MYVYIREEKYRPIGTVFTGQDCAALWRTSPPPHGKGEKAAAAADQVIYFDYK